MSRPTIFNKNVLQKLEMAFSMDCSDEEACIIANISPSSLYNYQKESPELLERKRVLRHMPILKARMTILGSLDDPSFAFKYMERKRRQEFGPSVQVDKAEPEELTPLTKEQEAKLDHLAGLSKRSISSTSNLAGLTADLIPLTPEQKAKYDAVLAGKF